MMREIMLTVHFIGLAMGLGTSLAFMFLGIASARMEAKEAQKFMLNAFSLSKMGHIGLGLLVISGLYLMTPYWSNLGNSPLLIAKLTLFLVLAVLIGLIGVAAKKAQQGAPEIHLKKSEMLGKLTLPTALVIVVLAVLIFR